MPPSRTGKARASGSGGFRNLWALYGDGVGPRGGVAKRGGRAAPKPPPAKKSFKKVIADYGYVQYSRPNALQWDESKLDAPKVDTVRFGENFSIDDSVLEKLIARPALCGRLTTFIAGSPDTGCGGYVHEPAFIRFIGLCPKLKLLCLDSHGDLGRDALLAIIRSCPNLEALKISGHDRSPGRIDEAALIALANACEADSSLAAKLRELCVIDQSVFEKAIRKLQKARRLLVIHTGETAGNRPYAKDDKYYTYKGGKMVYRSEFKYAYW